MRNGVVPERWTDFYESTHIPAAVRDGDRLYVTGHTGEDQDGNFSADPEFLSDPYPAWTAVGVTELIDEGAVVEIGCVAAV